MMLKIQRVLSAEQVRHAHALLNAEEWVDGRVTAGHQSSQAKNNEQLCETSVAAIELGKIVVSALEKNPTFISAALPAKIFPPLFNRYSTGHQFGTHVDNAVRQIRSTGALVRTDLSATLFLSEPHEYDGGELIVEDTYGAHSVKLPAGDMILYPASSLHRVQTITRGVRVAAFFWIQSMVREDAQRSLLFDLDCAIRRLITHQGNHEVAVPLTGVYHNLLRRWAHV
ncbi:MAG TPA: Fe2+-dependent dioxygenase [Steroidobacteraceae bacterium]|nr:Fe2+-dependent dioxygenase [Steroidobacteraceae bacterium]